MPGLIIGDDHRINLWACQKFNVFPIPANMAIGVANREGTLIGAIIFQNYNGINIELSFYGEPRILTANIVRHIAHAALVNFNVGRLTTITSRRNKRLIRGLIKIGFKLEGMQRVFYGHQDNKKNTGVRLVAFRDDLSRVAFKTRIEKKPRNVIQ